MHFIVTDAIRNLMLQYNAEIVVPLQLKQSDIEQKLDDLNNIVNQFVARGMSSQSTTYQPVFSSSSNMNSTYANQNPFYYPGISNTQQRYNFSAGFHQRQQQYADPQDAMVKAIRILRFTNTSANPKSVFNPHVTTSLEFLHEVERYYECSNVSPSRYLYLIPT